jgi:PTS hybrid protein
VLVDLGSAVLSAQLAIDELVDQETRGRVRIAEAPVVEGAVVAAVQASTGSALDEVDEAAKGAATMVKVKPEEAGDPRAGAPVDGVGR